MNKEQILAAIKDLAKSQGFYSRLLGSIEEADEETRNKFLRNLEAQKFRDVVDLVIYLES